MADPVFLAKIRKKYQKSKLSPLEAICMKCQLLLSGRNKKNISNLPSAEFAQIVVRVNAGCSRGNKRCFCL